MKKLTCQYTAGWSAVWISIALTGFGAFWGINKNFHEGWYYESLPWNLGLMITQFLSPMLLFLGITLVATFWRRVGAVLHLVMGLLLGLFFFRPLTFTIAWLIMIPMTGLAVLYWFGKLHSKKLAVSLLITLPLLTLIIYWWTATAKSDRQAYMIVYDGRGWPRSKQVRMGNLAFRAVRSAPEERAGGSTARADTTIPADISFSDPR